MNRYLVFCSRLVTCDPLRSSADNPLGAIADAGVLVDGGQIAAVGTREELLASAAGAPVIDDEQGLVLTPGLVDAHTHLAWAGSRHGEYVLRMRGADYEAIAAAGGGIVSTMRAVRAATQQDLAAQMKSRLRRMTALGVTTCEVKSGYGLDLASEQKQLRAIAEVAADDTMPRLVPTYLALHAIPPEGRADRASWVHRAADAWVDEIADEHLARFVDVYIDRSAFTVEEARQVFARAAARGLGIRAHVGQFADVGGAELAAEFRAASVDHVENVSAAGLEALAAAGTRAVLLPVASFTLRQAPPPIQAMRHARVPIVVASDANPGTAPTESLPLAMSMALHTYGLTPEECLLGATREAAASLGLQARCGVLRPGMSADFVVWDLPHEHSLLQPWGSAIARRVVSRGRTLHRADGS